jgi:hypothetical protein
MLAQSRERLVMQKLPSYYRTRYQILCPYHKKHIALPRRSREEMFLNQLGPTTAESTATFLCLDCKLLFECSSGEIRWHREKTQDQGQPDTLLWRLEFADDPGNSPKRKPIFLSYNANATEIAVRDHVFPVLKELYRSGKVPTASEREVTLLPLVGES